MAPDETMDAADDLKALLCNETDDTSGAMCEELASDVTMDDKEGSAKMDG